VIAWRYGVPVEAANGGAETMYPIPTGPNLPLQKPTPRLHNEEESAE
jgi:hypothetical protein